MKIPEENIIASKLLEIFYITSFVIINLNIKNRHGSLKLISCDETRLRSYGNLFPIVFQVLLIFIILAEERQIPLSMDTKYVNALNLT